MQIVSANYTDPEQTSINVVIEDMPEGSSITVPADPANKDYVELQDWAKAGNEIKAYVAPPPPPPQPTLEDVSARVDALASRIDALVEALHATRSKK
jgi:hypothetical protein